MSHTQKCRTDLLPHPHFCRTHNYLDARKVAHTNALASTLAHTSSQHNQLNISHRKMKTTCQTLPYWNRRNWSYRQATMITWLKYSFSLHQSISLPPGQASSRLHGNAGSKIEGHVCKNQIIAQMERLRNWQDEEVRQSLDDAADLQVGAGADSWLSNGTKTQLMEEY